MPEDNWKHRSKGMCCVTCMWYVPKLRLEEASQAQGLGRCRRRSPTLGGWPVMFEGDWCGDHKIDEEKMRGDPF
jgi:hypothetical protein